ncbi:MAG: outer membrane lipoprotein carrier protein LolA, partial [Akkermansiaceae bacterium]
LQIASAQHDLAPLRKALTQQSEHKTVSVKMRQEKTLPSLTEPVKSTGYLWLIPGKAFRWQLGEPPAQSALYDGKSVYLLDEKKKTVIRHDADSRKVKPLLLMLGIGEGASFDGMMKVFNVSGVNQKGERYVAVLVPKAGKLKRVIKHMTLQVNLSTSFMERIEWTQKDGTIVKTEFFRPTLNKPIPRSRFTFDTKAYTWK